MTAMGDLEPYLGHFVRIAFAEYAQGKTRTPKRLTIAVIPATDPIVQPIIAALQLA